MQGLLLQRLLLQQHQELLPLQLQQLLLQSPQRRCERAPQSAASWKRSEAQAHCRGLPLLPSEALWRRRQRQSLCLECGCSWGERGSVCVCVCVSVCVCLKQ